MMFECSAYSEIRTSTEFVVLFSHVGVHDMKALFCRPKDQPLLADFIRTVSLKRRQIIAASVSD